MFKYFINKIILKSLNFNYFEEIPTYFINFSTKINEPTEKNIFIFNSFFSTLSNKAIFISNSLNIGIENTIFYNCFSNSNGGSIYLKI